jgi:hypothetical protein
MASKVSRTVAEKSLQHTEQKVLINLSGMIFNPPSRLMYGTRIFVITYSVLIPFRFGFLRHKDLGHCSHLRLISLQN